MPNQLIQSNDTTDTATTATTVIYNCYFLRCPMCLLAFTLQYGFERAIIKRKSMMIVQSVEPVIENLLLEAGISNDKCRHMHS